MSELDYEIQALLIHGQRLIRDIIKNLQLGNVQEMAKINENELELARRAALRPSQDAKIKGAEQALERAKAFLEDQIRSKTEDMEIERILKQSNEVSKQKVVATNMKVCDYESISDVWLKHQKLTAVDLKEVRKYRIETVAIDGPNTAPEVSVVVVGAGLSKTRKNESLLKLKTGRPRKNQNQVPRDDEAQKIMEMEKELLRNFEQKPLELEETILFERGDD